MSDVKEATKKEPEEKPKRGARKGQRRKKYHQMTKAEVGTLLDKLLSGETPPTSDELAKEYKVSLGTDNKLIRLLKSPMMNIPEYEKVMPKGYMFPSSVDEVVDAALYDKGYKIVSKK